MASNVNILYTTGDGVELKFTLVCNTGSSGDGVVVRSDMDISHPNFLHALAWAQRIYPYVRAEEEILEFGEFALSREYAISQADIDLVLEAVRDGIVEISERAIYLVNEIRAEHWHRRKYEPRKRETKGFVYLLKADNGSFKIGRTKNPKSRSKAFSVTLPFDVEFICLIETPDMFTLETQLHERFASKRGNGEWFDLLPDDVDYIKGLAR